MPAVFSHEHQLDKLEMNVVGVNRQRHRCKKRRPLGTTDEIGFIGNASSRKAQAGMDGRTGGRRR